VRDGGASKQIPRQACRQISGRFARITAHGGEREYDPEDGWNRDFRDVDWLKRLNGARLLHRLFLDLSEAKDEYRKVEHGTMITAWICENDRSHFAQLEKFLVGLMPEANPTT
jgi:hypothetical protein